MKKKHLSPAEEIAAIRQKMGHFKLDWTPSHYLNTGSKRLNSVLGRKRGIPAGKMIEISGPESNGKTALAMDLVSIAQAAGWVGLWYDAEHSIDANGDRWMIKRGVDLSKLGLIQPYDGAFGKKPKLDKKTGLYGPGERASAEMLCGECEEFIKVQHRADPDRPIIFVVDSVSALLTEYELGLKIEDANMRSKLALASFMSQLLRRWVGLFQTHNVLGIFINQLRTNPGQMFGNPETTPGGKALRFYCHVRVRVGRTGDKKSMIMQSQKQLGIKSIIENKKNKVGGIERRKCGYKMFFNGSCKFCSVDDVKSAGEEE